MPDPANEPVLVSPVYLAGCTYAEQTALLPLLDEEWPMHDDDADTFHLTSPDTRIRLAHTTGDRRWSGAWAWHLTGFADPFSAPTWAAKFTHATPTELLTALAAALPGNLGLSSPSLARQRVCEQEVFNPLHRAGWERPADLADRPGYHVTAPDSLALLALDRRGFPDLRLGSTGLAVWQIAVRDPDEVEPHPGSWTAAFSRDFPLHLLAALTRRLADPTPVHRYPHQIPEHFRTAVHSRAASATSAAAASTLTAGSTTGTPAPRIDPAPEPPTARPQRLR
ncbi:hypothetical protein BIV57_07615 [Mangrovactinospora gilvigrisea]|uniref:DUF317 domain-containing protein n=1 Tax=Mangrovactinospora gilvigrisea TaxID=1428644 RepID=A0A1J7BHE0_9ACTN|nr:DUF317 domain-containing protein [Mangrovactinospora gilvigrisea]OIV38070.1 hypothetical protein BIV57_07615 [Mangrovactinospora gilvigrisea]